mmetsp:Transcript_41609/g.61044  ORF Transcript_41609/g.61044 Transcript_41609/m.61044 type:complete len:418 (+) Transcript_41609:246-1499(+)|eukprot:CAMPEP_0195518140 /NCGR_PEP_ID=MMETSP0794_2-20130614/12339_1 /TAXON_ID=515487 /ORGANISM="Stephanopyxis turris, Strain CCMP 815" /LENGTH=417 /DNA_ID=CAMNT_0040647059 /DNA_START=226 /DNA_END=1479 /DNA_ORIENTATION=+
MDLFEDDDFLSGLNVADDVTRFAPSEGTLPDGPLNAPVENDLFGSKYRGVAIAHREAHLETFSSGVAADLGFQSVDTAKKPVQQPWMVDAGSAEKSHFAAFATPKLQAFYEEDTVTQFRCNKAPADIVDALVSAMKESDCVTTVDHSNGTIKLTAFVDHARVSATVRVFSTGHDATHHLVHYGRNFGDRIPATRLFFKVANASGLVSLKMPRLLRRAPSRKCCLEQQRVGAEEKAASPSFTPTATKVFVDMLASDFAEEALVGAQGIARACCCPVASKPYAVFLPEITAAYNQHLEAGNKGHLVSRDVLACLAEVIEKVGTTRAAQQAQCDGKVCCQDVLETMLQCASGADSDIECARASMKAVNALCDRIESVKSFILEQHHQLAVSASTVPTAPERADFLRPAAERLRATLGLRP